MHFSNSNKGLKKSLPVDKQLIMAQGKVGE